ncbi:MAG: alanine racemase [Methylomicrobium sp.]
MTPAAYVTLNLDAVNHNLTVVKRYAPQAKVMAVIKANAYGHGLLRIASQLEGIDSFAVARVDEGIRLRKAGMTQRIAIMEGFTCAQELDDLIEYRLDPLIHSFGQLEIIERCSTAAAIDIWLKIDTGMNRLGFSTAEFTEVYRRLATSPLIKQPIGFMTHLANADDRSCAMTLRQIHLFKQTVNGCPGPRSIANSAGILGWQASHADWVRPGIMLYGVSPFADSNGADFGLKPIMSLHSRLIAVKTVREGETVGYGAAWVCEKPITMGIVAIGYGDGYPRQARPGTPVLIDGRRVPMIGRVSMDMITVDLSEMSDIQPGQPVTLWGPGLPVEEVARWSDTIPYTLLCGITQRVQIVEQ